MIALGIVAVLSAQAPPEGLHGHVAVQIGRSVVVTGGITYSGRNEGAWVYSISGNSWKPAAKPPESRGFSVGAEFKGKALVLGGIDPAGLHSDRIDAYDPVMDKWSSFGKLPERMSRAAGAVWQGKLYLSGGYNGTDDRHAENSPRLWEFEPAKLTWRELEPMPTPRHGHRLVPFRGRLWAIGGFGGEDLHGVVESYDPVTNQWRKETSMPANRGFFGAGVVGGKLTVIGTIYGSPHPIQWTTKGWVETAAPDIPMQRFAAVVDGDGFLVFGGEPNGAPIQRFKP